MLRHIMGFTSCALIVLVLVGLFALGAIVIGILATGSRSHRSDGGHGATTDPAWMAGAGMGGAGDEALRPSHHSAHDQGSEESHGEASGDSGGFDGGSDGGGGADGGGGGGGGD